ncbi:PPC domain-containing DNA-binding protein [Neobacillus mesonae]|uniref:PPC domain-containing DNA-binding protein n=1 Tax=Neobacillus mesonae TaxID=1193713 RepID=UPI0020409B51|nr:PPC domain-containing DNA-binding protein [Neobacillus mesonae]MCM3568507.1 DNA-binding protein [Neobacillus mesonae]
MLSSIDLEIREGNAMRQSHAIYNEETGTLIGSLAAGEDLLLGILEQCEKYNIKAGSFQCMGSLVSLHYCIFQNRNGKLSYSQPIQEQKPAELLSGTGFIGVTEDGRPEIHFHGVLIDEHGVIRGGHFLEGGNTVAITIEFMVTAAPGAKAVRELIPGTKFSVFNFYREGA